MKADESCETCRFWQCDSARETEGECRRYAPRPYFDLNPNAMEILEADKHLTWPIYPQVSADEWCGEWAAK